MKCEKKMTVRDLQDALELDSPQSIYKWLRGILSFPPEYAGTR